MLFIVGLQLTAQDTAQRITPGRKNTLSQQQKPYLILISADGFRYDYFQKYQAKNLQQLSAAGVRASSMRPSFPSVTFPNHYTVATGLYPSHHGIVYNQFYDRNRKEGYNMGDRKAVEDGTWYGGIPLWVLAEKQGMISASYHFVGTEAAIQNTYPTYWYKYADRLDIDKRIGTVINWLKLPEEERPHLITFYFSDADHAGHEFGPDALQTRDAVQFIDASIGKLQEAVAKLGLPVNFIFLADHGMAAVETVNRVDFSGKIDTSSFVIKGGGTSLHLYAKNNATIQPMYAKLKTEAIDYDVYLRNEVPAKWHYNSTDDRLQRIGDILVVPHFPLTITSAGRKIAAGAHGFDPDNKLMHASFFAWGPAFKKGLEIPTFDNVHVYPMVCQLLGLTYTHEIDGRPEVLSTILK